MKTNQEIRNEITKAFKSKGWSNRKVGLKVDYNCIRANVKDLSIKLKDVEAIVHEYESISYDEYCGEILAGGNTFVFVDYAWDVLNAAKEKYMRKAEEIFEANKGNILTIMEKDGKELVFVGDGWGSWVEIKGNYKRRFAGSPHDLARAMAIFNAQGGI